jgi:hydroxymethylglutaryl-CoA reductase
MFIASDSSLQMKERSDTAGSEISGFYKLSPSERLRKVREFSGITEEESKIVGSCAGLKLEQADRMIENVVGAIPMPIGVATNFLINGKDYLVPMATEEPSVVAAASNAAKMARGEGGFFTSNTGAVMIGQIQVV